MGRPLRGGAQISRFEGLGRTTIHCTRHDRRVFRRRGRFVNGTSRRVRAPLTVYHGQLRVLVRSRGLSRDRLRRLVGARRALRRVAGLGGSLLLLSGVRGNRFASAIRMRIGGLLERCLRSCGRICRCHRVVADVRRRNIFCLAVGRALTIILLAGLLGGTFIRGVSNKRVQVIVAPRDIVFYGAKTTRPLSTQHVFRHFCRKGGGRNSANLNLTVTSAVYGVRTLELYCRCGDKRRYFALCTSARGRWGGSYFF